MHSVLQDEELLFPGAQGLNLISMYLAHRPGALAESDFGWVKINGVLVHTDLRPKDLPGKQGWYVDLATFDQGRNLTLSWELQSRNVAPRVQVVVGVFRNHNLRARTVLTPQPLELSSYQMYLGDGSFTV